MSKRWFCAVFSLFLTACAGDLVGEKGQLEKVEYPVGMAMHPNGRYAYVLSSNFNLNYRSNDGGVLHVVDLESKTALPSSKRLGSFGTNVVLSSDARRGYTVTRSDNSLVWFEISEDGSRIHCPLAPAESEDLLACRVYLEHNPTHLDLVPSYREQQSQGVTQRVEFDLLMIAQLRLSSVTAMTVRKEADGALNFSHKTAALVYSASEVLWHSGENFFVTGRAATDMAVLAPAITAEGEVKGLQVQRRIPTPTSQGAYEGRGMALDPLRRHLYLVNRFPRALYRYEVSGLLGGKQSGEAIQVTDMLTLPADVSKVVWVGPQQGGALYLSSVTENALYLVDPVSFELIEKIDVREGPYEMHYDAKTEKLYVLNFLSNDILAFDASDPFHLKSLGKVLN